MILQDDAQQSHTSQDKCVFLSRSPQRGGGGGSGGGRGSLCTLSTKLSTPKTQNTEVFQSGQTHKLQGRGGLANRLDFNPQRQWKGKTCQACQGWSGGHRAGGKSRGWEGNEEAWRCLDTCGRFAEWWAVGGRGPVELRGIIWPGFGVLWVKVLQKLMKELSLLWKE